MNDELNTENGFDDEEHRPDPEIVQKLDQESAEFNGKMQEFAEEFGFEHFCTCDTDYSSGNVFEMTACFGELAFEALTACRELKRQRDQYKELATKAIEFAEEVNAYRD